MRISHIRKKLWFRDLHEFMEVANNYFIIQTAYDRHEFINDLQNELQLKNFSITRTKRSFCLVLLKLRILTIVPLRGPTFVITTTRTDDHVFFDLQQIFQQHQNTLYYQVGLHNSLVYDYSRFQYFSQNSAIRSIVFNDFCKSLITLRRILMCTLALRFQRFVNLVVWRIRMLSASIT